MVGLSVSLSVLPYFRPVSFFIDYLVECLVGLFLYLSASPRLSYLFVCLFGCVTLEPCTMKCCTVLADSDAVTSAVKIDTITIPVRIHRMQNTRPRADLGERSPYLQQVWLPS